MRLASVEVIPYALPFEEPYVTARGTLTQREMVLLRLRSEEGVEGLGEAVPLSLRGGATIEQVVRELEEVAEASVPDLAGLVDSLGRGRLSAPARCALETALWDQNQRQAGAARPGVAVTCNATLVAGEATVVAAEAEAWAADGYGTFKLKLGAGKDADQVQAVREAIGDEARIRVDANASWTLDRAADTLAAIEPFGIELAEQPVATLAEMALLAQRTAIPLAADEAVVSARDAEEARRLGACAMTGIKLSKVGGMSEALMIAQVLPAYFSSALDGPVGIAAAGILAAGRLSGGLPLAHGLATQRLFSSTVAAVESELRDGMLLVPPGPGLGVEIDEDALRAHRI